MSEAQGKVEEKYHLKQQQNAPVNIQPSPERDLKQLPDLNEQQNPHSLEVEKPLVYIDDCDPEIRAYFESRITHNDGNKSMAVNLIDQKMIQLKDNIKQGFLSIPSERKSISDIISKSSPIAREEQRLNQYVNQKNELEKELRRMEDAIQNASKSDNRLSPRRRGQQMANSLSPQEHQSFIERITHIKKQIEQRKRINAEYQQIRMKELERKEEEALKERQEKVLIEKRNQAKQRLQQILKRRQKMNQQKLESSKRFKSVSQKKRLHQQMEEQFQKEVYLPMIQERSKILAERSKKLKEIKVEDILQYEKQYIRKKEERQERSRSKPSQIWEYKHPPYSSKMVNILEEEKIAEKIREEQQKRRIEELKSRQENYKQYLKERFSTVKIDEKKRLEISTKISKQKSKKETISEASMRDIGNKYLSEAKSRIKITQRDKKQSLSTNEQATKKVKIRESYKIKPSTSMSNYESQSASEIKSNTIDQILSSRSISEHQKVKKLQFEIQRLSEKAQRKELLNKHKTKGKKAEQEDLDNILSSIKAKLSFIELYKK